MPELNSKIGQGLPRPYVISVTLSLVNQTLGGYFAAAYSYGKIKKPSPNFFEEGFVA